MAILSVDTSAAVSVSVLTDSGVELSSAHVPQERRHAEELTPLIVRTLDRARCLPSDITTVVAGRGPAPFTGLRVGLVTAQAFAFGVGATTVGVCSLDAIAAQAAYERGYKPGTRVMVLSDARRKEVYYGHYQVGETTPEAPGGLPHLVTLDGPGVMRPQDLAQSGLLEQCVIIGRGADLYRDDMPADAIDSEAPSVPSTTVLAQLACAALARGEDLPATPLYLRRPDAQVPAARKRATA
ncbi:tRNA (adenosine(37)-N6)-threonylcarbamoyltransferase complex dimerization subunit type 1 TsaB [Jonesia quinghaiensis]|uniref:tRNA (adenosine(37)-N6)-threonylcarbamoyltransferase complex dimerization subunit type 1 TsaB n=1 Tax=Jonesia quinghaiensis TaxID=262806 RepID=UPI00041D1DE2|nr:tRNA (adenosine(37)-N6)-threonylcarbamoyltransferase complex dimerization subunit type 1 TsaB [Jonesia quinghaiensis]